MEKSKSNQFLNRKDTIMAKTIAPVLKSASKLVGVDLDKKREKERMGKQRKMAEKEFIREKAERDFKRRQKEVEEFKRKLSLPVSPTINSEDSFSSRRLSDLPTVTSSFGSLEHFSRPPSRGGKKAKPKIKAKPKPKAKPKKRAK